MWPNTPPDLVPGLQKSTDVPHFPLACFALLSSCLGCQEQTWVKSGQFQGFAEQNPLVQRLRGCTGAAAALTPAKICLRISLSPLKHLCQAPGELLQIPTLHLLVYNDGKVVILQDAGKLPQAVLQADLNRTKNVTFNFSLHLAMAEL